MHRGSIALAAAVALAAAFSASALRAFAAPAPVSPAQAAVMQRWRGLGDAARHLGGPPLSPHDLDGVPVLVVRYSLSALKDTELRNLHRLSVSLADHPLAIVGSVMDEDATRAAFEERCRKDKKDGDAARVYPQYAGFAIAEDEPPVPGRYDYYLVDESGKVEFSAYRYKNLRKSLPKLLKGRTYGDRFLGNATVPPRLAPVAKLLAPGKSTEQAFNYLRRQLRGPDGAEAAKLLDALERTWRLRLSRIVRLAFAKPARAHLEMDALQKEFPQAKSDARWAVASGAVRSAADAPGLARLVAETDALLATRPANAAEAKKCLSLSKPLLAKLAKYRDGKTKLLAEEARELDEEICVFLRHIENLAK